MANMQIPAGFTYNPSNGLYYSQINSADENGNPITIVTWFNPHNGQYSQEIISAAGQPVQQPIQQPVQQPIQQPVQQPIQQPVQQSYPENYLYPNPPRKKSKGFLILMIICAVLIIGCVIFLVIYLGGAGEGIIGGFDRITINSNYDTAEEMYLVGDYAGAVEKYKKILKKNETEVDAYLGMATALYRLEEYDKAAEILAKGYAITNSDAILEKIAELKDLTGADAMEIDVSTITPAPTTPPSNEGDDADDSDSSGASSSDDKNGKAKSADEVDYSVYAEVENGFGNVDKAGVWENFTDGEREPSGQSDYVLYDRYGEFLGEFSLPEGYESCYFTAYSNCTQLKFLDSERTDSFEGVEVSNTLTDQRLIEYFTEGNEYDINWELRTNWYYVYDQTESSGENFYGNHIYCVSYVMDKSWTEVFFVIPYINSKGHRDFLQVGYSGDEISGVNPRDAMLGIFMYTTR